MSKEPVRRPSDGKMRVYGLGWVSPRVVAILLVIIALALFFDLHLY